MVGFKDEEDMKFKETTTLEEILKKHFDEQRASGKNQPKNYMKELFLKVLYGENTVEIDLNKIMRVPRDSMNVPMDI